MRWYYLSFASATEFLGACIVEARTPEDALAVSRARGLNPGGEVFILPTPEGETPPFPVYKLLSKAELGEGATLGEMQARGFSPPADAVMLCEDHNKQRRHADTFLSAHYDEPHRADWSIGALTEWAEKFGLGKFKTSPAASQ